ncbi:hypothetical protein D9M72_444210 [compost metagenome]
MEGILGIDDLRPLRTGRTLGKLDGSLHRFRAGRAEEDHVEVTRRAGGDVLGQRRRILRHEGDGDLVTLLVLELLPRFKDARMVMAEGQRAEATEEIEDLAAVLVGVEHALGAFDLHLVEAKKLHKVKLSGIQMLLESRGDVADRHGLCLFHGDQFGLCHTTIERRGGNGDTVRYVQHGVSPHSAGTATAAVAAAPIFFARYSS